MSLEIATIAFTLGEDMSPILLRVDGALYEEEIVSILADIKKTYPSPERLHPNWMQAELKVFVVDGRDEGDCDMEFLYKDVFLH